MSVVDPQRRACSFSVLGGPTTVVDIAGLRPIIDPTFDPPGPHNYLTKTAGPALPASALGATNVVLISHGSRMPVRNRRTIEVRRGRVRAHRWM